MIVRFKQSKNLFVVYYSIGCTECLAYAVYLFESDITYTKGDVRRYGI